jgi:hypothetical protein
MKLLQNNKALHAEEFSNASPYIIMFGPDKCGATNKVSLYKTVRSPRDSLIQFRCISSSGTRTPRRVNMRRNI